MNTKHTNCTYRTAFGSVVTLLIAAFISTPVFAGDNKVYAGSTCKPTEETGATGLFYGNNTTNLGLVNVNVVCPVVRDDTTGPVGGGPNAFIDVNSNLVTCSFDTTNEYGLGTFNSIAGVPVFVAAGIYRMDIRGVPQVAQGAYKIRCTLPPNTAILRYSVAE
jgi:hypothetical protein